MHELDFYVDSVEIFEVRCPECEEMKFELDREEKNKFIAEHLEEHGNDEDEEHN